MKRLTVKTGVYQDDGHREVAGMKCGVELKDIFDRLVTIEDILGDDYDLDRLKVIVNQQMTMREEVSQRFSLTAKIPIDRLKRLVEAEMEKRVIIAPAIIKTMSDINRLELKIYTKDWIGVTFRYENCAIGVADALKQLGFILDAEDALKGKQDG